ncbi:lipase secretion chaperone [Marinobacteraceae bacterium S3BR75-40.1]
MKTTRSPRKSTRRDLILVTLAVGLSVGGALWLVLEPSQSVAPVSDQAFQEADEAEIAVQTIQSEPPAALVPRKEAQSEEPAVVASTPKKLPNVFASSLEGTDIDGALTADAAGNLVVNLGVRDFFDYFLNTVGEVPPEEAIAQMHALMKANLPASAVNQGMALLGKYLNFKRDALELARQPLDQARKDDPDYQLEQLKAAMHSMETLRRETFTEAEREAFFGMEEAYAEYTVKSLEIQRRDDLSPQQKQDMLAYAREQLPEEIRRTEQHLREEQARQQAFQQTIEQASSPEAAAIRLREQGMAEEQVAQVKTYLQQRDRFEDSYKAYREAREQLDKAGLAEKDLERRRQALLEEHFDTEQGQTWARLRDLSNG